MEDVIQTYMLPYDRKWPVVCFDEASRQLFGEVRPPEPGKRAKFPALRGLVACEADQLVPFQETTPWQEFPTLSSMHCGAIGFAARQSAA